MARDTLTLRVLTVTILAFFCVAQSAFGEDGGSSVFSLEESIRYALGHSWAVKEKEEKIVENGFAEKEAKSDMLPVFSTSYRYTRLDDAGEVTIPGVGDIQTGDRDNYQWRATVVHPLFTGYALTSAYELSKLGVAQSEAALALEKTELALKVKEAYFNVLKADKAVGVAEKAVAALTSHQEVAKRFYEVGMTAVNDLLKAEVELANAQHNLIRAQNEAGLARVSFNVLLARPVGSPVVLEDALAYVPVSPDYVSALEGALKGRPEMKAVAIAENQADHRVTMAKSKRYPEAVFVADYIKQGDSPDVSGSRFQDPDSWQAMVEFSWTFWDWKKTEYAVSRNESAKRQVLKAKKDLENNIGFEVKKAMMDIRTAEEKIPTAEKAVAQAEENLRVSEERYKARSTTSTEVLDAQALLSQARMNYYNALYDHKLAVAALRRAMGEY
jgi:outer membrane protein TolC